MTSIGESDADRLKRDANASYQDTKAEASGAADEAKSRLNEAGERAKAEAGGITERAKDRISAEADARKDQAAGRIAGIADRAHQAADDLRSDEAWLANAIDSGARYLDDFASAVRTRDFPGLLHEVEDMARRQPGVFMGATVALGFMLGRFLRSSQPSGYGGRSSGYTGGYGGYDSPRYRGYARHDYGAESGYRDASRDWQRSGNDQDPLRGGYASGGGTSGTGYAGTAADPSRQGYLRPETAAVPGAGVGTGSTPSSSPIGTTTTNKPGETT